MSNPVITQTAPQWGGNAAGLHTLNVAPFNEGDLLVVCYYANGGPATAVSGGGGASWQCASSYFDTSGSAYISIWWSVVTSPGTAMITVTDAGLGTHFGTIWCREFMAPGANWQAGPVSKLPGSSGAGTGPSGGSGSTVTYPSLTPPAGGNALYVGAGFSYFANMSAGSDSGFFYTAPNAGGSGQGKQVAYITPASAAVSTSAPITGSSTWLSIAAMFTAGGGLNTAPAWASAYNLIGGGSGSWTNPGNAVGVPSGPVATWTAP